nr:MAG TPA: hypothetical protein [Caudoviricetes sp.]
MKLLIFQLPSLTAIICAFLLLSQVLVVGDGFYLLLFVYLLLGHR